MKKNRIGLEYQATPSVFSCLSANHYTDHNNTLSDAIKMAGDNTCSFAIIKKGNFGQNRGEENVIFRRECSHDISNNLRECHLSGENLTEVNLILARAGLLDLNTSKLKGMTIYPTHRNNLGR